jgi:hypothetical protein
MSLLLAPSSHGLSWTSISGSMQLTRPMIGRYILRLVSITEAAGTGSCAELVCQARVVTGAPSPWREAMPQRDSLDVQARLESQHGGVSLRI